jgi:hypothetical protein
MKGVEGFMKGVEGFMKGVEGFSNGSDTDRHGSRADPHGQPLGIQAPRSQNVDGLFRRMELSSPRSCP